MSSITFEYDVISIVELFWLDRQSYIFGQDSSCYSPESVCINRFNFVDRCLEFELYVISVTEIYVTVT